MVDKMFRMYLCPHQILYSTAKGRELPVSFTKKVD
jgi:hypothetical protein